MKALGDQTSGTTVLQVACGGAHTVALCDNGDVYTWGSNDEMQLGLGSTFGRKVNRPELVAELGNKGVLRIAAGAYPLYSGAVAAPSPQTARSTRHRSPPGVLVSAQCPTHDK